MKAAKAAYQIAPNLSFVIHPVPHNTNAQKFLTSTHHVIILDCSGSMAGDLPRMREHIKTKIAKMLRSKDTLSVMWFSGRGEFGLILDKVTADNLLELKSIHDTIDRWLRPVGLTGFLEPFQELARFITGLNDLSTKAVSVSFLSDGYDNQWARDQVLQAVKSAKVDAATVVEYGYYADRVFLAQIAATWGANHVFADRFVNYEPVMEQAILRQVLGGERVILDVGDVVENFVVVADKHTEEIVAYAVEDGKVSVPSGTEHVYYLAKQDGHEGIPNGFRDALKHITSGDEAPYALISVLAPRMRSDLIRPLLKWTGDVAFVEQYANCFGKQAYSEFQAGIVKAVFNDSLRFIKGYDPSCVPATDAFTVLDLLQFIADSKTARIDLNHPEFVYKKIGRSKTDANNRLTKEERETLDTLQLQIQGIKDVAKLKEVQAKIDELINKPEPLEFEEDPDNERGFDLRGLVLNEDRPNVSFRVKKQGFVDISKRLEGSKFETVLPVGFPTFVYRTYTVIRDGIRNLNKLPVVGLSLGDLGVLGLLVKDRRLAIGAMSKEDALTVIFDLSKLPIVNGQSVEKVSARTMFEKVWEKIKVQARLKVFKSMYAQEVDKKAEAAEAFVALYGDEASAWLADQGITAKGGFAPSVLTLDSTDVYMAKLLEVKVKGYSSLPSVAEVMARRTEKKKPTATGALMLTAIEEVESHVENREKFQKWLNGEIEKMTAHVRQLQYELARIKFSIIVGQTWFVEFASLDETTMTLTLDGLELHFTAVLREVEEKV